MADEELTIQYWLSDKTYKLLKFVALTVIPVLVTANAVVMATVDYPGAVYVTLSLGVVGIVLTGLIYGSSATKTTIKGQE